MVWRDSALVRAAREGRVLMIDEADKAPLEVVCILKVRACMCVYVCMCVCVCHCEKAGHLRICNTHVRMYVKAWGWSLSALRACLINFDEGYLPSPPLFIRLL